MRSGLWLRGIIERLVFGKPTDVAVEWIRTHRACVLCGRDPAAGFAMIGDDRYCHGDSDPTPTCYMRGQGLLVGIPQTGLYELHAGERVQTAGKPWEPPRPLPPS